MYLSNTELKALLTEMKISGTSDDYPFEPENQIQLCSIDFRISNIFWKPKKVNYIIDLGNKKFHEVSPRREWKRLEIELNESIILKPGEIIIGRTYEWFRIPNNYAGKIVARSSCARLGISVTCSSDFINPGWQGHVPLIIKNHGINTVKLYPLLGMCQIMVIKLSSLPEGVYGVGKFLSSYQNDEGGPSFWWRHQVLGKIKNNLESKITEKTWQSIIKKFEKIDDEGLTRFENFLNSLSNAKLSNSEDIISAFVLSEKKRARKQRVHKTVLTILQSILAVTSIGLVTRLPFSSIHYCFWSISLITLPFTIWFVSYREETKFYHDV